MSKQCGAGVHMYCGSKLYRDNFLSQLFVATLQLNKRSIVTVEFLDTQMLSQQ